MMKKDRLSLQGLNPEVIEAFKSYVKTKYGKLHTVLGLEVEKALIYYMQEHGEIQEIEGAHTHSRKTEQKPAPKKKENHELSPYHVKLTDIQEKMKTVGAWDTESFQDGLAVRLIKEICGGDPRTINKYYSDLETKWSFEHY